MSNADLESFRETLLELRRRLSGDVSQLSTEALRHAGGEASGGLSNTPIHMADLGSDAFEQEFTFGLLENQQQTIEEVDAALERIRLGTFARCEECGADIPRARLQALPHARHCVECARKLQQGS